MALVNLSHNPPARDEILKHGGIVPCTEYLVSEETKVREYGALAMATFCKDHQKNKDAIRVAGGIPLLVKCLDPEKGSANLAKHAASAINQLSIGNAYNKLAINEFGAIVPLVRLLSAGKEAAVTEHAISVIPTLCVGNKENDLEIAKAGGIPPIVELLDAGLTHPVTGPAVTAAMHLVREEQPNKDAFREAGGIPKVLAILEHTTDPVMLQKAVWIVANLCHDNAENQRVLTEEGAAACICRKLYHPKHNAASSLAVACVSALAQIGRHSVPGTEAARDAGAVEYLIYHMLLSSCNVTDANRHCLSALQTLARNSTNVQDLIVEGGGMVLFAKVMEPWRELMEASKERLPLLEDIPNDLAIAAFNNKSKAFFSGLCRADSAAVEDPLSPAQVELVTELQIKALVAKNSGSVESFKKTLDDVFDVRNRVLASIDRTCAAVQRVIEAAEAAHEGERAAIAARTAAFEAPSAEEAFLAARECMEANTFAQRANTAAKSGLDDAKEALDATESLCETTNAFIKEPAAAREAYSKATVLAAKAVASGDVASKEVVRASMHAQKRKSQELQQLKEFVYDVLGGIIQGAEHATVAREHVTDIHRLADSCEKARDSAVASRTAMDADKAKSHDQALMFAEEAKELATEATRKLEMVKEESAAAQEVNLESSSPPAIAKEAVTNAAEGLARCTGAAEAAADAAAEKGDDLAVVTSILGDVIGSAVEEGEQNFIEKTEKIWACILQRQLRKRRREATERNKAAALAFSVAIVRELVADAVIRSCRNSANQSLAKAEATLKLIKEDETKAADAMKHDKDFALEAQVQADDGHRLCMHAAQLATAAVERCRESMRRADLESANVALMEVEEAHERSIIARDRALHAVAEKSARQRLQTAGALPAMSKASGEPSKDEVLLAAATHGDAEAVSALTKQGAEVTFIGTGGYTLIHEAAEKGHAEAIVALIEAGAPKDAKTKKGSTALVTAATFGHLDAVRALIESEVDVNLANVAGDSPLTVAASGGHAECALELLKAGADLLHANGKGNCALHTAALGGNGDVIPMLALASEHAFVPEDATYEEEIVAQVSTSGAEADEGKEKGDGSGSTAEQDAEEEAAAAQLERDVAREERIQKLRAKILHDALEKRNGEDQSPLLLAAVQGHLSVVENLLKAGANPNAPNSLNVTPLHMAAYHGYPDIVQLLLEHRALSNIGDRDGNRALHLAVFGQSPEALRVLLDAGAQPGAKNNKHQSVRELAYLHPNRECQHLLNQADGLVAADAHAWKVQIKEGALDP
mmetsp:Transcript_15009/g.49222  ORF Transcript_15009/g.49222 Transcript_15009/m.49222 type:complete len:1283 (-) Transcript_15009:55-3903(-)